MSRTNFGAEKENNLHLSDRCIRRLIILPPWRQSAGARQQAWRLHDRCSTHRHKTFRRKGRGFRSIQFEVSSSKFWRRLFRVFRHAATAAEPIDRSCAQTRVEHLLTERLSTALDLQSAWKTTRCSWLKNAARVETNDGYLWKSDDSLKWTNYSQIQQSLVRRKLKWREFSQPIAHALR